MIVFIALRQHLYTVQSLVDGSYGPVLPEIRSAAYEDLLVAETVARATYVFTDIERLTPWERLLAADLFRALQDAGCRCLNDPARVLTRYPLLRALHRARINPFRAWRLEELPPGRAWPWSGPAFPLFIRNEADHGLPLTGLLHSRTELSAAIARLSASGVPLAGLLAVEFCAKPRSPGVWAKFGTFRVGDAISTDHAVAEDQWCVKHGSEKVASDSLLEWEREQIVANSYAETLRRPFDIAAIEYGRADHATVDGREVVYEINTNPHLAPLSKQVSPIRDEAIMVARRRLADALSALGSPATGAVRLTLGQRALEHRDGSAGEQAYRP